MAGCRPLTRFEERNLLAVVRRLPARDRAPVTTQRFAGFRFLEIPAMTLGTFMRSGAIVTVIEMARHPIPVRDAPLRILWCVAARIR